MSIQNVLCAGLRGLAAGLDEVPDRGPAVAMPPGDRKPGWLEAADRDADDPISRVDGGVAFGQQRDRRAGRHDLEFLVGGAHLGGDSWRPARPRFGGQPEIALWPGRGDHFNGVLGLVQDQEVPVYATVGVGRVIEEIADAKRAQWSPVYGDQWPAQTYYPNSLVADGAQVQVGELNFTVRDAGPAESHADSYLVLTADGSAPIAFIGDLAFHGTHPYTADGHSGAWLAALDAVGGDLAGVGTLYPGHGAPAGPGLLADQRRYLLYYRELIQRLSRSQPQLSQAAKSELSTALQAFLSDAPLTWMIELGADAVAAELAAAGH